MKTLCILIISLLCSALLQAQYLAKLDKQSISSLSIGEQQQLYKMDSRIYSHLDLNLGRHSLQDTVKVQDTVTNKYGDLRNDNSEFNKQDPLWRLL